MHTVALQTSANISFFMVSPCGGHRLTMLTHGLNLPTLPAGRKDQPI